MHWQQQGRYCIVTTQVMSVFSLFVGWLVRWFAFTAGLLKRLSTNSSKIYKKGQALRRK